MRLTIYERGERAMVGAGSNGRVRAAWLRVAATSPTMCGHLGGWGASVERFKKYCSRLAVGNRESGLFGFWLRFDSVTGSV